MPSVVAGRRLALMTRAAAVLAAALTSAALAAGCSLGGSDRVGGERAAPPRELTLLNPIDNAQELIPFADEVARLSRGALRIRIIPAGYAHRSDFEAATIRDMMRGRADLAWAGSRAWDEFGVRSLRALHAPLLIDGYALQERILTSDLVAPMLDELSPLGLVGIGILPGAMRRPFALAHRLAAPSDFHGLTIGVQQSRVADDTMRTLGARPVRLPAVVPSLDGLDAVDQRGPVATPARALRSEPDIRAADRRPARNPAHGCGERRAEGDRD
jgi:TRAP-type C4-dicarboxylate transport system substrate-binding protein